MTRLVAFTLTAALGVACAARPVAPAASHPASPKAPTGRLAGAPASLRPGVVVYPDVPAARPAPAHDHHKH